MLTWFRRRLGRRLGSVVGYPVNLIAGPVLLVISSLVQPWFWLCFSWGVLGTALGLAAGMLVIILGGEVRPIWLKATRVVAPRYLGPFGAFSLGPVLTGCDGFTDWEHEYGHTWQNRLLGPFYLLIVALPSLMSAAGLFGKTHGDFYTERWADAWSNWP
jgi:hypothetical protein